ncbi:GntR family transcriptional regulator [Actinomadura macrotermitis]|uniref:HTH-type transcriptional repressor RspR n=1 Tax=Actinomadura macrotermitis TaxID=2585200 RepID=A0A7K0BNB5_9ACTN|nr:GntR family transcriptional regulator [Actinomadura macrotermitis]MQY02678.1 HTH-type transcriptional repressor RspR [Actinomadura macrotermitis]
MVAAFPELEPVAVGDALADQAYRRLRAAIVERRLPPGTRLSVPDVARRLGVSRSPAREAIAQIVGDGLATFAPRKGAVVATVTLADLREIYEIREVLEGLAARLAASRITEGELDGLREVARRHREAIEAGDVARHMDLDQEFHLRIRRIARNGRLLEPLERFQAQVRIAMDTTRRSPGGMPQALAEHELIIARLAGRDPEGAEASARAHIIRLRRELVSRDGQEGEGHDDGHRAPR